MTSTNREYDELLTEHFRYTPLSLIDDIINAVNTIIYRAIEAVEIGLLNLPPQQLGFPKAAPPSTGIPNGKATQTQNLQQDEIENGCHQLETLLVDSADKTFDKFEIYTLRNILTVEEGLAPWMRLSHYEGLPLPLPETAATPESTLALRRKVQETRKLNHALRTQHHRNAQLISHLTALLSPPSSSTTSKPTALPTKCDRPNLSFLTAHSSSSSNATRPLQTRAQFTISQLPILRQHLEALRPKLQTLPNAIGNVDWDSKREERRAYLESRVRKVVGSGSGGEEERIAAMRGDAGRVGLEEVRAVEEVARGMGQEL
ncbi:hypothetical protein G7Y79_00020g048050 [Physcia stellaris]|nr:hypothetical protein G7Y79_00020g048050 [Physcia stellaris]